MGDEWQCSEYKFSGDENWVPWKTEFFLLLDETEKLIKSVFDLIEFRPTLLKALSDAQDIA